MSGEPRAKGWLWAHSRRLRGRPDLEKTSDVEVRFIAEALERTRVELERCNIDRHGDGWEAVREGVDSDNDGSPRYLQRFADVVAK